MTKVTPVAATYQGEELTALFHAYLEEDESDAWTESVELQAVYLLGHLLDIKVLPEKVQASIVALGDSLEEWEPRE